jgi:hypothetical protein|tara:strand:+ start:232 stop:384 length:153 start_codon:yes stop_codon:yes gene_type:complete
MKSLTKIWIGKIKNGVHELTHVPTETFFTNIEDAIIFDKMWRGEQQDKMN